MDLPKQLEPLRNLKLWLCYPMIWNETKHNGVGGYDKPPINPYTLRNGSSDNADHLATFDEAVAQIGKTAYVKSKTYTGDTEIKGVGIALGGTGICGLDLDNVAMTDPEDADTVLITKEANDIITLLDTYTELSPSGNGLHLLFFGNLPDNIKKIAKPKEDIFGTDKAEYQLFDSGYMTVSGDDVNDYEIAVRTQEVADTYDLYFSEPVPPIAKPSTIRPAAASKRYNSLSVVSSGTGITYERWLDEVSRLSDAEILDRIFMSGRTGEYVKSLYEGNLFQYDNDHSRADQALCSYLYGFTNSPEITERLFRSSALYRATGKSRNYVQRTINKASANSIPLIGHIEFTDEEKRQYAKQKAKEEQIAGIRYNSNKAGTGRKRYN